MQGVGCREKKTRKKIFLFFRNKKRIYLRNWVQTNLVVY